MGRSSTAGPSSGRRMLNGILRPDDEEVPPPPPPAYLVNDDKDNAEERAQKQYDRDMLGAALTGEVLNQTDKPSALELWATNFGNTIGDAFGVDHLGDKASAMADHIAHWTGRIASATSDFVGKTFHISNDYFENLAQHESGNRDWAHASTSTAAGAFQFVKGTWLGMVKQHGAEYGGQLAWAASQIQSDGRGGFYVENKANLEKILDMRSQREYSRPMAQAFTNDNANTMERVLGHREFTQADLYMAHFMGAKGAAKFLLDLQANPNATAANYFPTEAAANHNVFFDKQTGGERSLAQVYNYLGKDFAQDNVQLASSNTPPAHPAPGHAPMAHAIART